MIMSAQYRLNIIVSQQVGQFIPVIHITVLKGIVSNYNNIFTFIYRFQFVFQPDNILNAHMSIHHTDNRATVKSQKNKIAIVEPKTIVSEYFTKIHYSRLTPFRFVISGYCKIGHLQLIQ